VEQNAMYTYHGPLAEKTGEARFCQLTSNASPLVGGCLFEGQGHLVPDIACACKGMVCRGEEHEARLLHGHATQCGSTLVRHERSWKNSQPNYSK
jgi:hypothetical protein